MTLKNARAVLGPKPNCETNHKPSQGKVNSMLLSLPLIVLTLICHRRIPDGQDDLPQIFSHLCTRKYFTYDADFWLFPACESLPMNESLIHNIWNSLAGELKPWAIVHKRYRSSSGWFGQIASISDFSHSWWSTILGVRLIAMHRLACVRFLRTSNK